VSIDRQKIMLVEDDAELVRGLGRLLESDGFDFVPVTASMHAIPVALREQPDLIVLDVMMPGADGWEVLARLRASSTLSTTPVMMLTAKSSVEDRVFGLLSGADDYLTKPFALQEFRARVTALLRRTGMGSQSGGLRRLPVISEVGQVLVDVNSVLHIEGMRNHSLVVSQDGSYDSRMSLSDIGKKAGPDLMRVHRSHIVNLNAVRGCRWATKSAFVVLLTDGSEVPVSRTLVAEVRQRLGLC